MCPGTQRSESGTQLWLSADLAASCAGQGREQSWSVPAQRSHETTPSSILAIARSAITHSLAWHPELAPYVMRALRTHVHIHISTGSLAALRALAARGRRAGGRARAHLFRRQIAGYVRSDHARVAVKPRIKDNARNRTKHSGRVAALSLTLTGLWLPGEMRRVRVRVGLGLGVRVRVRVRVRG